jgi:hypothetical protein
MAAELIPIEKEQHSVVLVPRATTDLPFFYLTKQKASLTQSIDYEGLDPEGRPMRWQVFPNISPAIGAPAIDAHQSWMRLVKPTFDEKLKDNEPLDIVPLGKMREALRKVGWGVGGWEARRLLKALHQIGAASCVADLWIPTLETNAEGKPVYKHINARFSKLSIYAIGSTHLTDEQLKKGEFNFDFDLEDTLYVQLHPIEVQIQRNQPQKYIDNQYLFSVSPASRRWYELIAGKIFGVVKNKGEFCEVRYSWYVQHHHTLKRYYERYRVVFQMNRVVKDHLDSGYISKVEYRAIKEPDQELDYIIRYYPGEGAKESIARIQGHIYRRRSQKKLATKAPAPPALAGSEAPTAPVLALSVSTAEDEQVILQLLTFGVVYEKAFELATEKREATRRQLEYWPYRAGESKKNRAGWIIRAIERNYSAPQGYQEAKEQEASQKQKAEEAAARKQAQDEQERQAAQARAADDARLAALPEALRSTLEAQAIEQARRQYGWMRKKNWDGPLMQAAVRKIMIELLDSQEQGSDQEKIN